MHSLMPLTPINGLSHEQASATSNLFSTYLSVNKCHNCGNNSFSKNSQFEYFKNQVKPE